MGDVLNVKGDDDGSLEVVNIVGPILMTVNEMDADVTWSITTLPEEADLSKSLIRHLRFLATCKVEGASTSETMEQRQALPFSSDEIKDLRPRLFSSDLFANH